MTKYLTNESLIRANDRAVMSWCSDHDPADGKFHGGILDPMNPTLEELETGWINFRNLEAREPEGIGEIVWRSATWRHIPKEEGLRAAPSRGIPATGLPFGPFEHFRYVGFAKETVLLSNWIGPVEGGRYRGWKDAPPPSEELGGMIEKMVDRYATRGNWRGYTNLDEMKAEARLSMVDSMLKFSPLKSSNPFALAGTAMKDAFLKILKRAKEGEWAFERTHGDMDVAEDGEGLDLIHGETWTETSDREFEEAERAWRANQ